MNLDRRTVAVAFALSLLFSSARAQDLLDLGLFADETGTVSTLDLPVGEFRHVHLIAFLPESSTRGLAFQIRGLDMPGLLSTPLDPLGGSPGAGLVGDGTSYHLTFEAYLPVEGLTRLLTFQLFADEEIPADTALCLDRAELVPSSLWLPQPVVLLADYVQPADWSNDGYYMTPAQNGDGRYPNGCLIVNATQEGPIANAASSWGAVKSLY